MTIRVRFAPSPTGYLHIGGARTALFNWLFARKNKGTFILRIEDTDEVRSTDESVGAIIKSMRWLGLDWDEGPEVGGSHEPYFQVQRKEKGIYQQYIEKLFEKGNAYRCYCTTEDLEEMRDKAKKEGKQPKYDRRCLSLTENDWKQNDAKGKPYVIRFKRPDEETITIPDIICGENGVTFDNNLLDDFVLVKSSGVPTYNFACVVDDIEMEITHVFRGNDHLSNTPKQVQLYKVLEKELPKFAHFSMILGSDGSRLSKRHGHTSVLEYRDEGYLPEALKNYLALLGWSTEDSQQIFEQDELIEKFSVERCSTSAAVFDPQKLLWMNGEYIRKKSASEITKRFFYFATKNAEIQEKIKGWDKSLVEKYIGVEQEKLKLLSDIPGRIDIFFVDNVEYEPEAVNKVLKKDTARMVLEESLKRLENQSDFGAEALEKYARDFAAEKNVGTGKVFHPLRVAVSGRTQGPSLFHMMELLGKDKVLKRINDCLNSCF
ncbi:MAG: glutamate--tRNA ligase [Endomicrobiales bacterium]|nr:glutamate--tRNA ligase [Endomicrobiales bacterium]